jgi:integrase
MYGIFKYAKKKQYVNFSITQFFNDMELSRKVFNNRRKPDETQVFSEDEVGRIIVYLQENESIENLGIMLLFQTGLRVGELAALKPEDRVNERMFHVSRTEINYKDIETKKCVYTIKDSPKTPTGDRYVLMTDGAIETWEKILRLRTNNEYLFEKKGKRIRERVFYNRINRICDDLHIERRSTHKIRKTYGTELLNSGVDEKLITGQMGHVSIATTKGHYYYNNRTVEKKVEILNRAMNY